eukprot:2706741-Amphidinium_carterae.1
MHATSVMASCVDHVPRLDDNSVQDAIVLQRCPESTSVGSQQRRKPLEEVVPCDVENIAGEKKKEMLGHRLRRASKQVKENQKMLDPARITWFLDYADLQRDRASKQTYKEIVLDGLGPKKTLRDAKAKALELLKALATRRFCRSQV